MAKEGGLGHLDVNEFVEELARAQMNMPNPLGHYGTRVLITRHWRQTIVQRQLLTQVSEGHTGVIL